MKCDETKPMSDARAMNSSTTEVPSLSPQSNNRVGLPLENSSLAMKSTKILLKPNTPPKKRAKPPRRSSTRAAKTAALAAFKSDGKKVSQTKDESLVWDENCAYNSPRQSGRRYRKSSSKRNSITPLRERPTKRASSQARRKRKSFVAVTPLQKPPEPTIKPSERSAVRNISGRGKELRRLPGKQVLHQFLPAETSQPTLILARLSLDGTSVSDHRIRFLSVVTQDTLDGFSDRKDPFPIKLYSMVQWTTKEYPDVCRWSRDGSSIKVHPKHPSLLLVLRQFFRQSKWYSFARQLNNYGFCQDELGRDKSIRVYRHEDFHRDVPDPSIYATILPYLPGKKFASKKNNALEQDVPKAEANIKTDENPAQIEQYDRIEGILDDDHPQPKLLVSTVDDTMLLDCEQAIHSVPCDPSGRTDFCSIPANEIDDGTFRSNGHNVHEQQIPVLDSFKTPSPPHRNGHHVSALSSPPLLSHYLKQKEDPQSQELQHSLTFQNEVVDEENVQEQSQSPSSLSLMTMNILKTPSPRNETTPRISNLSSSTTSNSYTEMNSSLSCSWGQQKSKSPLRQHIQMVSMAVSALETPETLTADVSVGMQIESPNIINDTGGLNPGKPMSFGRTNEQVGGEPRAGDPPFFEESASMKVLPMTPRNSRVLGTALSYVETFGCSPIQKANPSPLSTSDTSLVEDASTVDCSDIGPSPLSITTEISTNDNDLEILKSCLDDIFV